MFIPLTAFRDPSNEYTGVGIVMINGRTKWILYSAVLVFANVGLFSKKKTIIT